MYEITEKLLTEIYRKIDAQFIEAPIHYRVGTPIKYFEQEMLTVPKKCECNGGVYTFTRADTFEKDIIKSGSEDLIISLTQRTVNHKYKKVVYSPITIWFLNTSFLDKYLVQVRDVLKILKYAEFYDYKAIVST